MRFDSNPMQLAPAGLALLAALAQPSWAAPQAPLEVTTRVSVDSSGTQGNGASLAMSLSADARFVAFKSTAINLVPGDTNFVGDVFVHDRETGATELVSVSSSGVQGNKASSFPGLSADGRYVIFHSAATNLVPGDTNGATDVFVHDRQTGITERVSVSSAGIQANGKSLFASLSADGRYATFRSEAANLVFGDSNAKRDIFVHDRQTGTTERVSVDSAGIQGNGDSNLAAISADGNSVAFTSDSDNLVAGDTNAVGDIFVHDRTTGITERVSISSSGVEGNAGVSWPTISDDGQHVAFLSDSDNLFAGDTNAASDVFVHDRQTATTTLVSRDSYGTFGNGPCNNPVISASGRYVAFTSFADNLVPGDLGGSDDIYVHDLLSGFTERVSLNSAGVEGNQNSSFPAISEDGRYVAFNSTADNLVAGDTNGQQDVFVHDRRTGGPQLTLDNVVAGQLADFSISGATPDGLVVVGVSLSGQGPTPSPWGPMEVAAPFFLLSFSMDSSGQISLPIGIPVELLGTPLWVQGIDVTLDYPTSVWGGLVQ